MKGQQIVIMVCALACPAMVLANPEYPKVRFAHSVQRPVVPDAAGIVLRQDLFDRNNPNNLRSDWPGPPAQPGPAH